MPISQDELLSLVIEAIRLMDCSQLRLWLTTIKLDGNPTQLPLYDEFHTLFTEHNRMHTMTKITFIDFAQMKLELECS